MRAFLYCYECGTMLQDEHNKRSACSAGRLCIGHCYAKFLFIKNQIENLANIILRFIIQIILFILLIQNGQ